jgi:hypothetical protein
MSFMDKLKSGLDKAQQGINDFAETQKIKSEIGALESRKNDLFAEIGKAVYAKHAGTPSGTDVDAACHGIDTFNKQIADKQAELTKVGTASNPDAPTPA